MASRFLPLTAAVLVILVPTACGGGDPSADVSAAAASASAEGSASSASSGASSGSPTTQDPSNPASSSAVPPDEGRLAGEGYSFTLPTGWDDATDQFRKYSELIDVGAVNGEQAGQLFSDNVNVLRNADQTELPVATAERQFADELGTVASRVRVEDPTTIDGVPAVHLSGRTRAGEVVALTDQFIAFVDDAYYVVTFSYSTGTPDAQRADEVAAMLASWAWE